MKWHRVADIGEIEPKTSKLVEVAGKKVGIFHENGSYYAVLNVCPHAKAEICRGKVTGTLFASARTQTYEMRHDLLALRCPWHHWEFSLETGKAIIPSVRQRLKTYQVKVGDAVEAEREAYQGNGDTIDGVKLDMYPVKVGPDGVYIQA